jgi:hypothetical protein
MSFSHEYVMMNVCKYLEMNDLCSLDAASIDVSSGMIDRNSRPHTWIVAATSAGLTLGGVKKTAIKALFGGLKACFLTQIIVLPTNSHVQQLTKAVEQMQGMKKKHVERVGQFADTFVANFTFRSEDVDSYQADPQKAISSNAVTVCTGDRLAGLTLTWKSGSMYVSAHALGLLSKPFGVHLRTVSSPVTMRMDFKLREVRMEQAGRGLCCMLQTQQSFAESLREGILCAGLAYNIENDVAEVGFTDATTLGGLQIDKPGWQHSCEMSVDASYCQ